MSTLNSTEHANTTRFGPDVTVHLFEAAIFLAGACGDAALLIYSFNWGVQHWSTILGPLCMGISAAIELPLGYYFLQIGIVALQLAYKRRKTTSANKILLAKQSDKQDGRILTAAKYPLLDDADWLAHFTAQTALDPATSPATALSREKKQNVQEPFPYPKIFDEMALAASVFHEAANGLLPFSASEQSHYRSAYLWLVRSLIAAAIASIALFWTQNTPFHWISVLFFFLASLAAVNFLVASVSDEKKRFRHMGCLCEGRIFRSRKLLSKRLILLLAEPFGGPFGFLENACRGGDASTRLLALFRPSAFWSILIVLLPISTWIIESIPWMDTHIHSILPILIFAVSIAAAGYFHLTYQLVFFRSDPTSYYPPNMIIFRIMADAVRRLFE